MYYTPKSSEIDATRYPDLRKWVVGCLSSHKKPNDIIFQLCRRTGWDWGQAKRFVEQVVEMDQKQVHQKRMPLLLGIGVLFLIAGTISFISAFIDLSAILSTIELPLDLQKVIDAALMARSIYYLIGKLVFGMIGVVGGGYGIMNAVKSAMTGEGEDLLNPQTPGQT
jgi:hypothetical protein